MSIDPSMKDTMHTSLTGYVINTFQDQAYFEHYFDLGPYGKAFLSPIEHIGILTWHRILMMGFGDMPLLICNDTAEQLKFLKIDCTLPNDFDLLKKLTGGYELLPVGLGYQLIDSSNNRPLAYHDTTVSLQHGKFYDEHIWVLTPAFNPTGAFDFTAKAPRVEDDRLRLR
ncbi:hypothetical protein PHOBOS_61 [Erwinia phage vB_EamM_Phobos]|uniref:hypothetical protein n=1 Tax=Erwinia phage vB_EamM_Phobos TaxID=1883377 RepID=UPI00081C424C|nr:hypothetical protein BIZ79_gp061 [Erwinia phage vB_EamM_Phobos]ANZ50251.1 hypothetical protein PHOBOS_61 [Erwinia phage vB_EamM_Phobos]